MLLTIVLLAAAGVRLIGIDAQSLWFDEIVTTQSAAVPLIDVITAVRAHENSPPLYYIVVNVWTKLFGLSETAVRMPSALFGIATVWALYGLGSDLFDRRTGLTAAALLAVSPFHVAFSQEARSYALVLLLCVLCCAAFVRMLRTGSVGSQVAYVVTAALAMYTFTFAAFVLLAINAAYVVWLTRIHTKAVGPSSARVYGVSLSTSAEPSTRSMPGIPLRRWLTVQAAVVVLFGPWVPATLEVAGVGLPWLRDPTPFHVAMAGYAGSYVGAVVMAGLAGVAVGHGVRRRDDRVLLLVLLSILPILGPLAAETFTTRYGITALTGLSLLTAWGAGVLGRATCAGMVGLAIVGWFATSTFGAPRFPNCTPKIDLRSASAHVAARAAPGDGLRTRSHYVEHGMSAYYRPRGDLVPVARLPRPGEGGPDRVWLVTGDTAGAAAEVADSDFIERGRRGFFGVEVLELRRRPAPPAPAATEPAARTGVPLASAAVR